jgi:hypothetical protein
LAAFKALTLAAFLNCDKSYSWCPSRVINHAADGRRCFRSSDALRDLGSHLLRVDEPSVTAADPVSSLSGAGDGERVLLLCLSWPGSLGSNARASGGERYGIWIGLLKLCPLGPEPRLRDEVGTALGDNADALFGSAILWTLGSLLVLPAELNIVKIRLMVFLKSISVGAMLTSLQVSHGHLKALASYSVLQKSNACGGSVCVYAYSKEWLVGARIAVFESHPL